MQDESAGADKYEIINEECWLTYAQYEGAMLPVKRYSTACQTASVIVHEELFWARSVIEELRAPFFVMHKNISSSKAAKNLKVSTSEIALPVSCQPSLLTNGIAILHDLGTTTQSSCNKG